MQLGNPGPEHRMPGPQHHIARSGVSWARLDPNTCQTECQRECQKECQNICQKVCQNRWQIECQKECQIECQSICHTECQVECQNIYIYIHAIYTSRWHVRNDVRIVCQVGDHCKNVFYVYLERVRLPTLLHNTHGRNLEKP